MPRVKQANAAAWGSAIAGAVAPGAQRNAYQEAELRAVADDGEPLSKKQQKQRDVAHQKEREAEEAAAASPNARTCNMIRTRGADGGKYRDDTHGDDDDDDHDDDHDDHDHDDDHGGKGTGTGGKEEHHASLKRRLALRLLQAMAAVVLLVNVLSMAGVLETRFAGVDGFTGGLAGLANLTSSSLQAGLAAATGVNGTSGWQFNATLDESRSAPPAYSGGAAVSALAGALLGPALLLYGFKVQATMIVLNSLVASGMNHFFEQVQNMQTWNEETAGGSFEPANLHFLFKVILSGFTISVVAMKVTNFNSGMRGSVSSYIFATTVINQIPPQFGCACGGAPCNALVRGAAYLLEERCYYDRWLRFGLNNAVIGVGAFIGMTFDKEVVRFNVVVLGANLCCQVFFDSALARHPEKGSAVQPYRMLALMILGWVGYVCQTQLEAIAEYQEQRAVAKAEERAAAVGKGAGSLAAASLKGEEGGGGAAKAGNGDGGQDRATGNGGGDGGDGDGDADAHLHDFPPDQHFNWLVRTLHVKAKVMIAPLLVVDAMAQQLKYIGNAEVRKQQRLDLARAKLDLARTLDAENTTVLKRLEGEAVAAKAEMDARTGLAEKAARKNERRYRSKMSTERALKRLFVLALNGALAVLGAVSFEFSARALNDGDDWLKLAGQLLRGRDLGEMDYAVRIALYFLLADICVVLTACAGVMAAVFERPRTLLGYACVMLFLAVGQIGAVSVVSDAQMARYSEDYMHGRIESAFRDWGCAASVAPPSRSATNSPPLRDPPRTTLFRIDCASGGVSAEWLERLSTQGSCDYVDERHVNASHAMLDAALAAHPAGGAWGRSRTLTDQLQERMGRMNEIRACVLQRGERERLGSNATAATSVSIVSVESHTGVFCVCQHKSGASIMDHFRKATRHTVALIAVELLLCFCCLWLFHEHFKRAQRRKARRQAKERATAARAGAGPSATMLKEANKAVVLKVATPKQKARVLL